MTVETVVGEASSSGSCTYTLASPDEPVRQLPTMLPGVLQGPDSPNLGLHGCQSYPG